MSQCSGPVGECHRVWQRTVSCTDAACAGCARRERPGSRASAGGEPRTHRGRHRVALRGAQEAALALPRTNFTGRASLFGGKQHEPAENILPNPSWSCNFRILREQQHWTQSLLTVRGPLQQDVAVQEAAILFRAFWAGGHGVPGICDRNWFYCDGRVKQDVTAQT